MTKYSKCLRLLMLVACASFLEACDTTSVSTAVTGDSNEGLSPEVSMQGQSPAAPSSIDLAMQQVRGPFGDKPLNIFKSQTVAPNEGFDRDVVSDAYGSKGNGRLDPIR